MERIGVVSLDPLPIVLVGGHSSPLLSLDIHTVGTAHSSFALFCDATVSNVHLSPIRYPLSPTSRSRHAPPRKHYNTLTQPLPPRRCHTFQEASHISTTVGRDAGGVAGITHTPGSVHLWKAISEFDSRHTIATARPSVL